ncbi:TPA: hypothetical protein MYS43_002550 [Klebsiella pneumoniae]|nr:hypothetical protein [Klebsiella pneumoniae]
MKRSDIERYERESVIRALGNNRGPGDDGAQQLIRSSERRRSAQPSGKKVKQTA